MRHRGVGSLRSLPGSTLHATASKHWHQCCAPPTRVSAPSALCRSRADTKALFGNARVDDAALAGSHHTRSCSGSWAQQRAHNESARTALSAATSAAQGGSFATESGRHSPSWNVWCPAMHANEKLEATQCVAVGQSSSTTQNAVQSGPSDPLDSCMQPDSRYCWVHFSPNAGDEGSGSRQYCATKPDSQLMTQRCVPGHRGDLSKLQAARHVPSG